MRRFVGEPLPSLRNGPRPPRCAARSPLLWPAELFTIRTWPRPLRRCATFSAVECSSSRRWPRLPRSGDYPRTGSTSMSCVVAIDSRRDGRKGSSESPPDQEDDHAQGLHLQVPGRRLERSKEFQGLGFRLDLQTTPMEGGEYTVAM